MSVYLFDVVHKSLKLHVDGVMYKCTACCGIQALPAKPRLTNGGVEGESSESAARIADLQQALEQQVRMLCLNVKKVIKSLVHFVYTNIHLTD